MRISKEKDYNLRKTRRPSSKTFIRPILISHLRNKQRKVLFPKRGSISHRTNNSRISNTNSSRSFTRNRVLSNRPDSPTSRMPKSNSHHKFLMVLVNSQDRVTRPLFLWAQIKITSNNRSRNRRFKMRMSKSRLLSRKTPFLILRSRISRRTGTSTKATLFLRTSRSQTSPNRMRMGSCKNRVRLKYNHRRTSKNMVYKVIKRKRLTKRLFNQRIARPKLSSNLNNNQRTPHKNHQLQSKHKLKNPSCREVTRIRRS